MTRKVPPLNVRQFRSILSLAALLAGPSLMRAGETPEPPVVPAAAVLREGLSQEASFEAELRPFLEIEVHARISGYLDSIKVDAGDLVKENQLIATLDQPELKMEIEHAVASERRSKADIDSAQATYEDAHLAYTRVTAVNKSQPNLIAQQDLDAARSKDRATAASLDAAREQQKVAQAEVKKLTIMEGYTKITAPFNGVITKRYADPGALIQAGTSTGSQPLVRLSQNDLLRAVFPVSPSFVSRIKVGDEVQLHVEAVKKVITGKVARFSHKVDTSTRHMDVEVDVPNPDLTLIPGVYATAVLKMDLRENTLSVPVDAVARSGDSASVYVIGKDRKIEDRPVTLGLETASRLEILSGVNEGELVLTGSRTVVKPGDLVEPRIAAQEKPEIRKVVQAAR